MTMATFPSALPPCDRRIHSSEVTNQTLENIVQAVSRRKDLHNGANIGRDPLLILNISQEGKTHQVNVRCEMIYRDGPPSLVLENDQRPEQTKIRILEKLLQSNEAQIQSVRVAQSSGDHIIYTALFNSQFEEKLALLGIPGPDPRLSLEQLWDPEIMAPFKGQYFFVASPNSQNPRFPIQDAGEFGGVEDNHGRLQLCLGDARYTKGAELMYFAPILVFDSLTEGEWRTSAGRDVVGIKDFFERMVPQGTVVDIEIGKTPEKKRLTFKCISDDEAVFFSDIAYESYTVRDIGHRSDITKVTILDEKRQQPTPGTYQILTPIFTDGKYKPDNRQRKLEKN